MKKFITLTLFLFFFKNFVYSQQYVFSETTTEALQELKEKVTDPEKYNFYKRKIEEFEKSGKVILSTEQFYYIKLRIDGVKQNPLTEEEVEMKAYVDKAKKKYISISDIIE